MENILRVLVKKARLIVFAPGAQYVRTGTGSLVMFDGVTPTLSLTCVFTFVVFAEKGFRPAL